MSKVRINDLARELEVKSKAILDALVEVGITEKKTHSSSLEPDEAERVRAHFLHGAKDGAGAAKAEPETSAKPKIDWSRVSKPGDVLKAIQQRKQEVAEAAETRARAAASARIKAVAPPAAAESKTVPSPKAAAPAVAATVTSAVKAQPESKTQAAAAATAANPAVRAAQPPARRKIVPQPRQEPRIVSAPSSPSHPAIAAKPPAGPVAVKPPAPGSVEAESRRVAPVVAPPAAAVSATASAVSAPSAEHAPAEVVSVSTAVKPAASAAARVAEPASSPASSVAAPSPAPVQPPRRIVMPQTGPRPVYKAPPTAPAALGGVHPHAGIQRGRPIFDRARPGAFRPGQRPGQSTPGARRPMHPTRSQPSGTGPGSRPGFGRPGFGGRPQAGGPGMAPPPGAAPRSQRPGQRRGRQQYPKVKEGPMKGFTPPSHFGGAQIPQEPLPITRSITVTEGISVKDLAEKLGIRGKDLIATLLMRGVFVTVNQSLDADLVKDVAAQFGASTELISFEDEMANEALESLVGQTGVDEIEAARPPVVTVMGHVDHGKTSLLDAIRETDVAAGEVGGITQHIGAYKVRIAKPDSPAFDREIVFLDTPGHEAFTRMRARGAKVTDIVVIVVAADDGVMPQTLEAIDHAKAAGVPMIVAVNKIDKPGAQPDRVKQQLADRGLVPEAWGGSTVFVDVSAKKRQNLDLLLEMICLVADLANLKATPGRPAVGTVIEAKLDRGRGAVATVLVQNGTLHAGDSFVVGNTFGKIRAMFDDRSRPVESAGPSTPVEILGLEGIPDAGDTLLAVADRDKARSIAQYRQMKEREAQLAKSSRVSLEGLAEQIKHAGTKELPLILKGDVTGSVEVLADSLQKMSTEKVRINVIHTGVGAITESDILLASASNAVVIGFNVRPERKAAELAERDGVDIRLHSIIYELQDEIKKAMLGLLEPTFKEIHQGRAEVLNTFRIPKVGTIAGCRVVDGSVKRDADARLVRDGVEVYKGKLASLKRFKDDAREVTSGMECGIGIANFNDIKIGDVIETFTTERIAAVLTA